MSPERVEEDLTAYIAGDDRAGERICRALEPAIRTEVARFLPPADLERDDIVQETLLALLTYVRRTGRRPDRPEAFVVTMAGNRCRNLYRRRTRRPVVDLAGASEWLAGTPDDPLQRLADKEQAAALRGAFARLDPDCRRLLAAIYEDRRPMEELQRKAGLGTVQGIYYRKYACLKKLAVLLNRD